MTQNFGFTDIDSLSAFVGQPLVLVSDHGVIISSSRNIPLWMDYHDIGDQLVGRMLLFFDKDGKTFPDSIHPLTQVLQSGRSIREVEYCLSRDESGMVVSLISLTPVRINNNGEMGVLLALHPSEASGSLLEPTQVSPEPLQNHDDIIKAHVRMLSLIHHDLKSPLVGIEGIASLLLQNLSSMSKQEQLRLISLIHRTSSHTFKLADQLFNWAVTQTKAIKVMPKPLSLSKLLSDNLLLSANSAEEKKIRIDLDCSDEVWIFADEHMLGSVIQNLMSNAVKYTAPQGRIMVSCEMVDKAVQIKIQDTGMGMSADTLSQIFVGQGRVSKPGTAGEQGLGLGLVLVKYLADKNAWNIRATSQPGQGSQFIFTLPLLGDFSPAKASA